MSTSPSPQSAAGTPSSAPPNRAQVKPIPPKSKVEAERGEVSPPDKKGPRPQAGPGSRDPSAPPQGSPREARGGERGELRGLPGVYPDVFEEPGRRSESQGEESRSESADSEGGREERARREPGERPETQAPDESDEREAPKPKLKFAGRDYDGIEGAEHAHKTLQGNFRTMQRQRDEAAHAAWAHKERADALEKQLAELRSTPGGQAPGSTPGYDPQADPHLPEHMKVHARRMAEQQARTQAPSPRPPSREPEPDLRSMIEDPALDEITKPSPEAIYDASKSFSEQFDWQTYHALNTNVSPEAAERYLEAERESHWAQRVKSLLAGPLREINQFRTTLRVTKLFEDAQGSGQYPELLQPKSANLVAQIWAKAARAMDPKFAMSPAGVHYAILLYRDYVSRHSGPDSGAQPGNGRAKPTAGSPGGTPASVPTTPRAGDEADAVADAVTDSLRPRGEALTGAGSTPQSRTPASPLSRDESERRRAIRAADLYIPGLGFTK